MRCCLPTHYFQISICLCMKYYLVKTDPDTYSINDFKKEKKTVWNGVRNAQAVITLKAMQAGDRVFVYHSQGEGSIRGLAEVVGGSKPDPDDAKSWLVTLRLLYVYAEPYATIKDIREVGEFADFALLRQSRLSVMPVPKGVVQWLKKRGIEV